MVFLLVALVSALLGLIAIRLLRGAWSSGGPEGWLGFAFLGVACSMPLRVLVASGVFASGSDSAVLLTSHALMAAGLCCFTLFVDRVFRPDAGWAIGITVLLVGLQIATLPALVFFGGHRSEQSAVSVMIGFVRSLPFLWGFLESIRYHRQMRMRAKLGLADPVVTNRFALFAVWTGTLFALPMTVFVLRLWVFLNAGGGRLLGDEPAARLSAVVLGLALAVLGGMACASLWLSFFPPRFWRDRVERSAASAAA